MHHLSKIYSIYHKHIICSFMRQITADVSFLRYALKSFISNCINVFPFSKKKLTSFCESEKAHNPFCSIIHMRKLNDSPNLLHLHFIEVGTSILNRITKYQFYGKTFT